MASHGAGDQYIPPNYREDYYGSSVQSGASAVDIANNVKFTDPLFNPSNVIEGFNQNINDRITSAQENAKANSWENSWLSKMEQLASTGNVDAQQWLANYYASEKSAQTARDWTAQREDSAYSRLVADLQKAGISPYILSGATPAVSSSSGRSYSGTEMVSRSNNKDDNEVSNRNAAIQSILKVIGVTLAAIIYAMA